MRRSALAALVVPLWFDAAQPAMAQAPPAPEAAGAEPVAGPGDVTITADAVSYDWQARRSTFAGNVRAVRGDGWLRADRGTYDAENGMLTLSGGVFGIQGREVFVADEAVVDVNAREASLRAATLFLKDRTAPLPSDAAHARAGKNALTLKATTVRRLDSGAIEAGSVTMTPCDCAGDPDYDLRSPNVHVEGDRAILQHPSLGILGASIPLPVALSLPLTDRQSGLLFPPLTYASTTGFGPTIPVFVTLGRSYDTTIAPGFFTGSGGGGNPTLGLRSVVGPRYSGQFRYAPVEGTAGLLDLDLVQDLRARDSPFVPATFEGEAPTAAGRGFGGLRGVVRFDHRTRISPWYVAAKGTVATDVALVSDIDPPSQLDRYLDSLRTDAGGVWSSGPMSAGADVTLLQDVRIPDAAHPDRRLFGAEARSTFQRLPAAFLQLAPVPVGPAAFAIEASAARFASLAGISPQEAAIGFGPTALNAPYVVGTAAAQVPGGSRDGIVRLDVAPRLLWGNTGSQVLLAADVGGRADVWFFDSITSRNRQRAYASGGVRASSSLERGYGTYLHSIEPAVELRAISPSAAAGSRNRIGDPYDAGGDPFSARAETAEQGIAPGLPLLSGAGNTKGVPASRRPYDEIDGAAPENGEALARAVVSQSLWVLGAQGHAPARVARLDLSQDVVAWDGQGRSRIGEAGALLQLSLPGRLGVEGRVQLDWGLHAVTQLSSSAQLRSDRGDEVHGGLQMLRGIAAERLRAGIDELFGAARLAANSGPLVGGPSFGGSVGIPLARQGLRAAYDASHYLGELPADVADWTHVLGLAYDTPCRCAGLQVAAAFFFRGASLQRSPVIHVVLDLKSLGSFASF
ncbi:MAG: LptA/OstA family protein [Myxococcales bacterium]